MPGERPLLSELARRTEWKTIKGLWSEATKTERYTRRRAPPDPPAPLILYDLPVVFDRDGVPMWVDFRQPKNAHHPPVFSTSTSPPRPTPPAPPSPTPTPPPPAPPSPTPTPPPIHASVTDRTSDVPTHSPPPPPISAPGNGHASPSASDVLARSPPSALDEFLVRTSRHVRSFDWKKGCYIGLAVLSVYLMWRCYRRWGFGGGGGDQRDEPEPGAGAGPPRFHRRGLADALLEYEGDSIVLGKRKAVDDMLKLGDALFGPYEWEKFDLLVLPPPSFPFGGISNSRMVFLADPGTIKVEAAGALVWTTNISPNKTNEYFWLNEGFTAYAERRIVEVLQSEEQAAINMRDGWKGMDLMLDRLKNKLEPKMAGIDLDDALLWHIERLIGRPAFEEFLKKYITNFKFQSIDTDTFLQFLKANVPGIENQIDLDVWIEGTGIPPDAMEPDSATYRKICTLAAEFKSGKIPSEDEVADWSGQEWELYLENLSTDVEASQVSALDVQYKLSESRDYQVKVAFLQLAIPAGCRCYYNEVENCLKLVGRMKYLRINRQGSNITRSD